MADADSERRTILPHPTPISQSSVGCQSFRCWLMDSTWINGYRSCGALDHYCILHIWFSMDEYWNCEYKYAIFTCPMSIIIIIIIIQSKYAITTCMCLRHHQHHYCGNYYFVCVCASSVGLRLSMTHSIQAAEKNVKTRFIYDLWFSTQRSISCTLVRAYLRVSVMWANT